MSPRSITSRRPRSGLPSPAISLIAALADVLVDDLHGEPGIEILEPPPGRGDAGLSDALGGHEALAVQVAGANVPLVGDYEAPHARGRERGGRGSAHAADARDQHGG